MAFLDKWIFLFKGLDLDGLDLDLDSKKLYNANMQRQNALSKFYPTLFHNIEVNFLIL